MPTPKVARTAISAVGSTTPVSTTALETTTCQRRGTAAMVAEIMREPYSLAPARGGQDPDQEHRREVAGHDGPERVDVDEPAALLRSR